MSGTAQKEENTAQKNDQKEERINALLEYCKEPRDRDEMMRFLGIKHRTTFRSDCLNFLSEGEIAMTIPDNREARIKSFILFNVHSHRICYQIYLAYSRYLFLYAKAYLSPSDSYTCYLVEALHRRITVQLK